MADSAAWLKTILPFVVMCFGGFMALLDIQIVASSLRQIGGGLSAAQDQIAWVQTAYLIAEIVVIPLSGWLTRVFSTRWLFAVSAAGFTVSSLLCALAWNIESIILFRAVQGLLGASMIPTMFTSSFYYFQGQRRVYAAAVIGTIASIAPTLGPVIGGWITDTLNWHWLFYVNVLPGAVVTNPDQFSVTTSLSATNQNINGNRSDSQNLTVDGAFNLVAGSNGSLMNNVNPNFISEVKVQTSNMSAEWGRTAGVAFNVVTRNGTNQFHGALFENFRNDALDARNFFSVNKTQLRYNDFGYDIGGPIKKDKLFFFWGQDWKRLRHERRLPEHDIAGARRCRQPRRIRGRVDVEIGQAGGLDQTAILDRIELALGGGNQAIGSQAPLLKAAYVDRAARASRPARR